MNRNQLTELLLRDFEDSVDGVGCFEEGIEKTLDLDIPIHFANWMATNGIRVDFAKHNKIHWMKWENTSHSTKGTTKELFNYWFENIFPNYCCSGLGLYGAGCSKNTLCTFPKCLKSE